MLLKELSNSTSSSDSEEEPLPSELCEDASTNIDSCLKVSSLMLLKMIVSVIFTQFKLFVMVLIGLHEGQGPV